MVEFPGLWGLKLDINPVALHFGSFNIYWYGIIIAIGFALAVFLSSKDSKKFGIEPESIVDMVLWCTIPAIICARLYYIIFSWNEYNWDFYKMINIREGGIAIYGAVLGALISAAIFAKVRKIGIIKLFDYCVPYLVLAQGIGRWGNFVNHEAYGTHTSLPWGMSGSNIVNGPVHPTFLYESLWDLSIFFFLLWFRKRKKAAGEVFLLYMILYGFGRFWIEGLRTDSLMLGNLRISQVLAVLFVISFAVIFFIRRKKAVSGAEVVEKGTSQYGNILKEMENQDEGSKEAELPLKTSIEQEVIEDVEVAVIEGYDDLGKSSDGQKLT